MKVTTICTPPHLCPHVVLIVLFAAMPLRGAFVSEPRVMLVDEEKIDEVTGEVETTLDLIVEGYARRVKVQVCVPIVVKDHL